LHKARKAAGLKILGPSDTYGLIISAIAELPKRHSHAQSQAVLPGSPWATMGKLAP